MEECHTVRYCHIYESGLAGEVLEDVQQDLEGVSTVKLALTLVRLQQILRQYKYFILFDVPNRTIGY
jgi:hypothetical protein